MGTGHEYLKLYTLVAWCAVPVLPLAEVCWSSQLPAQLHVRALSSPAAWPGRGKIVLSLITSVLSKGGHPLSGFTSWEVLALVVWTDFDGGWLHPLPVLPHVSQPDPSLGVRRNNLSLFYDKMLV